MNEFKYLEIKFDDSWFEVKMKTPNPTIVGIIISIAARLFVVGAFLFLAIIGFIGRGYFYAILGLFFTVFFIYLQISSWIVSNKKYAKFKFLANEEGVTQTEANKTYFLPWSEIVSWGFVNHNVISDFHDCTSSERQICLYFARNQYSEKELRKKFFSIANLARHSYGHCCTEEIIVLGFYQDTVEDFVIDKIRHIICSHCDQDMERSYIDPYPII